MPELELVQTMTEPPAACLLCNCVPVDETKEDKPPLPAIKAVGLDVNWGESVYICWVCAGLISDLVDRPEREKVEAVLRGAKLQKKHNEKLVQEHKELQEKFTKLLDAQEVVREARKTKEAKK